ncbi:MAG: hypothetical protein GF364_10020 [Candidatus Lokiarchaeota archaeon]|nr:hypothetical protein [Candidatus Lokiarchaeota archaeon]
MKYPEGRKKYPCEEVCPEDFLTNDQIEEMIKNKDKLQFKKSDWKKLFNCVHCNECGTSEERSTLLNEFINQGLTYPGLEDIKNCFEEYGTPYPTNEMRVRFPEGIPQESDTLFFMGCLCTIRLPRYTEHALKYLLSKEVDFTVLDKEVCCGYPAFAAGLLEQYKSIQEQNIQLWRDKGFKKVICLCPACYYVFTKDYPKTDIQFLFVADYLEPSTTEKSGDVSVQHLCQLMNRGYAGKEIEVDDILEKSGYNVLDVPHWCCGGGIGYFGRTDVIDLIAEQRMKDFKGDFYTTYCPGCYWVLKSYKKHLKDRKNTRLKDIFQLLK